MTCAEAIKKILADEKIDGNEYPGGTDKNAVHSYIDHVFGIYLNGFINRHGKLLEIGVRHGGSSLVWNKLLPRFDICLVDKENLMADNIKEKLDWSRVNFVIADAYDEEVVKSIQQMYVSFDIIIDDGPHTLESHYKCIDLYLGMLNPGGYLIIEDIENIEHANILIENIPQGVTYQLHDLREQKGRYDDIALVITKPKPNPHVIEHIQSRWLAQSTLGSTERYAQTYQQATPFPHVVMDDFADAGVLTVIRRELDNLPTWFHDRENVANQVNKFFIPSPFDRELEPSINILSTHAPMTLAMLRFLKSPSWLKWLESVTGISDLICDDDWLGGGVHRITSGGFLDVHADFNVHWKQNLHRRLNLLIYLNPGWQESWGGGLELWDTRLTGCQVRVNPVFNRAVLFRIRDDAFHGHPDPVRSPEGQERMSLAMYYYTLDRPDYEKKPRHGVVWQNIHKI